jgi:hypothetical protein
MISLKRYRKYQKGLPKGRDSCDFEEPKNRIGIGASKVDHRIQCVSGLADGKRT